MNPAFIRNRKIEKAKDYAMQKERASFVNFTALFQGDNGDYTISYVGGRWECDCDYFRRSGDPCAHIMALQMMLADLVEAGVEA